jgi:hypothetical protein
VKPVRIPYAEYESLNILGDSIYTKENGLSTKCFVLSAYEVDFKKDDNLYLPEKSDISSLSKIHDGSSLEYFRGG